MLSYVNDGYLQIYFKYNVWHICLHADLEG